MGIGTNSQDLGLKMLSWSSLARAVGQNGSLNLLNLLSNSGPIPFISHLGPKTDQRRVLLLSGR